MVPSRRPLAAVPRAPSNLPICPWPSLLLLPRKRLRDKRDAECLRSNAAGEVNRGWLHPFPDFPLLPRAFRVKTEAASTHLITIYLSPLCLSASVRLPWTLSPLDRDRRAREPAAHSGRVAREKERPLDTQTHRWQPCRRRSVSRDPAFYDDDDGVEDDDGRRWWSVGVE